MSDKASNRNNVGMRPYNLDDVPFICDSVERELPKLPNYKDIVVARDRLEYLLQHNYGNAAYFQVWVLVDLDTNRLVGGGGGYCTPGMVTWDLIANDVFLFVLPGWRSYRNVVRLMTAYKDWAKARGCKLIMATQTGGYRVDSMNEIMRRQGYIEAGSQWMLRLDDAYLNRTE